MLGDCITLQSLLRPTDRRSGNAEDRWPVD
jgi:hypothetical protein